MSATTGVCKAAARAIAVAGRTFRQLPSFSSSLIRPWFTTPSVAAAFVGNPRVSAFFADCAAALADVDEADDLDRQAWTIILGEPDGQRFNFDTMSWERPA